MERVRRGVVSVVTEDASGRPLLRGGGFFVGRGRIVTSLHVLSGAFGARVLTHDGKTYAVERVAAASDERDLALLRIATGDETYPPLEVAGEPPREGEEVALVWSVGTHWHVERGAARGVWFWQGAGELIQITARIAGGNSGGPVVNAWGRVVGVAALFGATPGELNFAVASDAVESLIGSAARAETPAGRSSQNATPALPLQQPLYEARPAAPSTPHRAPE
jgi:serine protease Do